MNDGEYRELGGSVASGVGSFQPPPVWVPDRDIREPEPAGKQLRLLAQS